MHTCIIVLSLRWMNVILYIISRLCNNYAQKVSEMPSLSEFDKYKKMFDQGLKWGYKSRESFALFSGTVHDFFLNFTVYLALLAQRIKIGPILNGALCTGSTTYSSMWVPVSFW